jgi:hypothetical protein
LPCLALPLSLLFATLSPTAQAASLPDTGQTLCDNGANALVACSNTNTNTGDASTMPRQDGRFGRDPANAAGGVTKVGGGAAGFDYTQLDSSGVALGSPSTDYATTPWDCVQDNITGLMWEVKTNDTGLRGGSWNYSWYSSDTATNAGNAGTADGADNCSVTTRCDTEKYVADVNAANLCGHSDWRLPSKRELQTLAHLGTSSPAIESSYFPNTVPGLFWSASSYVPTPASAWGVSSNNGGVYTGPKTANYYVRLVRGGQF